VSKSAALSGRGPPKEDGSDFRRRHPMVPDIVPWQEGQTAQSQLNFRDFLL